MAKAILGRESSIYKSMEVWSLVRINRWGRRLRRKIRCFLMSWNTWMKQNNHGETWSPGEEKHILFNLPYIPSISNCCCYCLVVKSCLTLGNPMDYSPQGSSVHGIFQARIPFPSPGDLPDLIYHLKYRGTLITICRIPSFYKFSSVSSSV